MSGHTKTERGPVRDRGRDARPVTAAEIQRLRVRLSAQYVALESAPLAEGADEAIEALMNQLQDLQLVACRAMVTSLDDALALTVCQAEMWDIVDTSAGAPPTPWECARNEAMRAAFRATARTLVNAGADSGLAGTYPALLAEKPPAA